MAEDQAVMRKAEYDFSSGAVTTGYNPQETEAANPAAMPIASSG